jgi:hypothetical protein
VFLPRAEVTRVDHDQLPIASLRPESIRRQLSSSWMMTRRCSKRLTDCSTLRIYGRSCPKRRRSTPIAR